jgi:hypothetical protein
LVCTLKPAGPDVTFAYSGTLDTEGLTKVGSVDVYYTYIRPSHGAFAKVGEGWLYEGLSGDTSFGTGSWSFGSSPTGDFVYLGAEDNRLGVPTGFISGYLSGSFLFTNTDLNALGVTPGQYSWSWGSPLAPDHTITLTVFPVPSAIVSGETLSGTIDVASDMDAFQFDGEEGDRVLITAVTTSGSLNTVIYLYDPFGAIEADTEPSGDKLDHSLQQSGTYTIMVQDYGLNDTGTYNISFLDVPDGPLSSPGDPDGGPIVSGETLSGTIDAASDMDAFQFDGGEGERVIITAVTTSGSLNTEIYLYPPDGGAAEAHPAYGGDEIDHNLQQSGTYTIIVQDYGLNAEGTYNISFLNLSPPDPPTPDVKANGSDGPLVVAPGVNVNVTMSLDPRDEAGESADWWGLVLSSHGNFPLFAFQSPLFELPETSLVDIPLPPGWYVFLFNLDDTPDSSFDLMWYDYVVVVVDGSPSDALPDFEALVQEKIGELKME